MSTIPTVSDSSSDSLPAASVILAVTSSASPSAGALILTVTFLFSMSSLVNFCLIPLTVIMSPTDALSGKPIITSTLPLSSISAALIKASSLPT